MTNVRRHITCPYCGHLLSVGFSDSVARRKFIVYCEDDETEGACGKEFVVESTAEVRITVFPIGPASSTITS